MVTVGRLHPNKGMARVAAAWAGCPTLRAETNLVIVGGDLEGPSADEIDVLAQLDEVLGDAVDRRRRGAILLGHQPNESVAHVLAAAAEGFGDQVAPGGVYAAGATKEEFGLAIVEALGAGLPVVVPDDGGPPTYVAHGDTGIVTDTGSVERLRAAILAARALWAVPGRVARARTRVSETMTIDAMANALIDVYGAVCVGVP